MPESPLNEPTISELFALPPAELSDANFMRIIEQYRSERHSWNQKEKEKTAKKGAPKVAKGSVTGLTLDDLGLDL